MELSAEFPDRELSTSPKHGVVFRIPNAEARSRPDSTEFDVQRRYFRPHSAKSPSLDVPSRVVPTKTKAVRPWSAHARTKQESAQTRKLSRQTLRRPHFMAPPRSPTASISSETSSLITAVGLETRNQLNTSTPDSAKHSNVDVRSLLSRVGEISPPPDEKWAITVTDSLHKDVEPVKPERAKRSLKKYPSFETWIAGSPHDSDEYDTDLDIEDYVKSASEEKEKTIDATGKAMYEEQCERQGIIPVSYMRRHLGDKNLKMRHHYLGGSGTKPVALALRFNTITENLDLGDNCVEGEGAGYIASMLKENTFITSLEMPKQKTGTDQKLKNVIAAMVQSRLPVIYRLPVYKGSLFHTIFSSPEHKVLKNISRNFIGREGVAAISSMLETNTTLKTLNMSGNQLTDGCAQCLIEGLKNNSSLTSLDLSNNDFGEQGGVALGGAMGLNEGLIDVDLSWNAIRNRGATAVIASLSKNNALEVLDLSWNGLGLAGAEALKQALKVNTTLKVLDLTPGHDKTYKMAWATSEDSDQPAHPCSLISHVPTRAYDLWKETYAKGLIIVDGNNRFNTKASESLAWGLSKNFGLETLVLNLNPMKDAGVEAILKAVEKHPNLCLLSLEEVSISKSNYHKIQELQSEKTITILHGGVGGYERLTTATSMVKLFMKFVHTHHTELEIAFNQFDMERSGWLGIEDLKAALKLAGLRLTSRQMNTVLEEINFDSSTSMNYKNILNGKTLSQYLRQRPSRAVAAQSLGLSLKTLPNSMQRQLTVA